MQPLVIITARGGSKGVPGKNIKLLAGKPLIQYTIEAALAITIKENIIVSTDSEEIKTVVEELGIAVPELRPKELATDTAGSYEVLLHEIKKLESRGKFFSYLILLQPTSPFRKGHHIKEALDEYDDFIDMMVSVKETKANPYYILREEDENGFLVKSKHSNATRRQDVPKVWELNGAIYIINIESLKAKPINQLTKVKKYEMDEIASHDIDTMMDWKIAEVLINNN
jgi:N-acylneuraminate cytidylyltransferase